MHAAELLSHVHGIAAIVPGIMVWIHVRLWSFIQLMYIKTQLYLSH
jgi:hypothetical protein